MKTIWGKVGAIVAAAALVAVLVFSYVSAITNYDFTVFIFAGAADQETNRQLIEEWAAQYAEEHKAEIGKDSINVGISFQSDTNLYFSQVQREIASGKADDVFYVSPKYVKSFALNDAVLDLGEYVDWTKYDPNGVWADAVGAYAFVKEDNSIGNPVTYQENGSQGAGFYNEAGKKAGVYALPKDFSSFGLAYNRNFFTQTLREKYTTTEDTRGAVYSINADGSQGAQTNIINIGKTTRYYPFNYYKYENYRAALDAIYKAGMEAKDKIIRDYAESAVAVADIKIAVRSQKTAKTIEFMKRAMAECKSISVDQLSRAALNGPEAIRDYLAGTEYAGGAEALAESPSAFERWCDNRIIQTISPQKYESFTIGPVVAYVLARQNEIKTVRIILSGKRSELPDDSIRERVREMYV